MTTLPLTWPPLIEAAEARAREYREVASSLLPVPPCEAEVVLHAHLLADLTRAASRDVWARWLAQALGLRVGSTSPTWRKVGRRMWTITVPHPLGLRAGPTPADAYERRIVGTLSDGERHMAAVRGLYRLWVTAPAIEHIADDHHVLPDGSRLMDALALGVVCLWVSGHYEAARALAEDGP